MSELHYEKVSPPNAVFAARELVSSEELRTLKILQYVTKETIT